MLSTAQKDESLVSHILREAQKNTQHLYEHVTKLTLPESFHKFVLNYEANFDARDRFLWKWVWMIFSNDKDCIMLNTVPATKSRLAAEIKVLLTLADVIVDDVADQGDDKNLLDALLKIPYDESEIESTLNAKDQKKAQLLKSVFDFVFEKFKEQPNWHTYSGIVEFDLKQVWNSCLYSFLLNERPSILNYAESMRFSAFNMMIFLYLDVDLIFSRKIDQNEIGRIREVTMKTQEMARIGNWITTWEREVNEADLSSGIFAKIVTDGHITSDKLEMLLQNADTSTLLVLIKESLIENKLLDEWEEAREAALELAKSVKSVDMVKYVRGFDKVLMYHLTSVGHK